MAAYIDKSAEKINLLTLTEQRQNCSYIDSTSVCPVSFLLPSIHLTSQRITFDFLVSLPVVLSLDVHLLKTATTPSGFSGFSHWSITEKSSWIDVLELRAYWRPVLNWS